jgi:hypothetical protein
MSLAASRDVSSAERSARLNLSPPVPGDLGRGARGRKRPGSASRPRRQAVVRFDRPAAIAHLATAEGPLGRTEATCDGAPVWGNHVDLLASLERCSTQAASARPARRRRGWPGAIKLGGRHMRLLCSSSMTSWKRQGWLGRYHDHFRCITPSIRRGRRSQLPGPQAIGEWSVMAWHRIQPENTVLPGKPMFCGSGSRRERAVYSMRSRKRSVLPSQAASRWALYGLPCRR